MQTTPQLCFLFRLRDVLVLMASCATLKRITIRSHLDQYPQSKCVIKPRPVATKVLSSTSAAAADSQDGSIKTGFQRPAAEMNLIYVQSNVQPFKTAQHGGTLQTSPQSMTLKSR